VFWKRKFENKNEKSIPNKKIRNIENSFQKKKSRTHFVKGSAEGIFICTYFFKDIFTFSAGIGCGDMVQKAIA